MAIYSVILRTVVLSAGVSFLSAQSGLQAIQARSLIEQNRFEEALKVVEGARQKEPKNAELLYLRGYVLYRLHSLREARTQLEQVTRMAPPALRSCYFLGKIALLEGRPEEAIGWLKKPAEAIPPIEDAPAELGKAYLSAHQLNEAREWTEKAVKEAEWDGNLHYRLGRIYQQLGDRAVATKEFRESLSLKVVDKEAVEKLVESSQQIAGGNVTGARETRDFFLHQAQLDPDVLVALGFSFASAGLPEDAVELFEVAAHRDPFSFQARFDLGLALLNLQHAEQAVAPLEGALAIAPSSVDANSALGLTYVMLGNFDLALPRLEIVHRAQPENVRTEGLLALTYLRTGYAGKAVPLLKASLTKRSDDPKLYFLLVECLNSMEDQAGALSIADQAVKRFPELAKAHLARGQQLARLGRYREAGPSFAKAAELAPRELEPLLGLAEVQNKSAAYSESLATYREALAIDPKDVTAQLGAGRNLVALGRVAEAKEILKQAEIDHAESSQVHFELSRVYLREGSREEAARETEIVQRLRAQADVSGGRAR